MYIVIKRFWLTVCIVLSCCLSVDGVLAQTNNLSGNLLLTTRNDNTQKSTIWNVDSSNDTVSPVFSLDFYAQLAPNDVLSLREKSIVQNAANQGIIDQNRLTTPAISQYIIAAWQLDSTNILFETAVDFCEPIGHSVCFGYYEFSKLNLISNPSTPQSLFQLDYHHSVLDQWSSCNNIGNIIHIDYVAINPVADQVALTIKAINNCHGDGKSEAIIFDFSQTGANPVEIPLADGISWSPNGTRLGYSTRDTCASTSILCTFSIGFYSVPTNTLTVLNSSNELPSQAASITNWKDDNNIVYQSSALAGDTFDYRIVQRSLDTSLETVAFVGPTHLTNYYRLQHNSTILIGYQNQGKWAQAFSFTETTPLANFDYIDGVFSNNRYPEFIILQNNDSNQLTMLDSDLQSVVINLYTEIPPSELLINVSPAGIRLETVTPTNIPTPAPSAIASYTPMNIPTETLIPTETPTDTITYTP